MYFKINKENPIHETDALAELVMLPALILLVSELPDSLSTDTICPPSRVETRSDLPSAALGLICHGKRSGAAATFSGRSKDPSRPTGALSHEWKNIKNRLQLVALKVRNNLDQGLAPGGMDHLYSPTPL